MGMQESRMRRGKVSKPLLAQVREQDAAPWRCARTVSWCPPVAAPPHTSWRRRAGWPSTSRIPYEGRL